MDRRSLIVFAKYPRDGEVKTRLGAAIGMRQAAEVYNRIALDVFAAAEKIRDGRVYLCYTGADSEALVRDWVARPSWDYLRQEGNSLGERMQASFAHVFREGADRAVIIGTDTPGLGDGTLEQAFTVLATADVVLGPSTDGGYYLLGMRTLIPDLFREIPWSSPTVFSVTRARAESAGLTISLLNERSDIDTKDDLDRYVARQERAG